MKHYCPSCEVTHTCWYPFGKLNYYCGKCGYVLKRPEEMELCPYCGSKPVKDKAVIYNTDSKCWHCSNDKCPIQGVLFTKDGWNTRSGDKGG